MSDLHLLTGTIIDAALTVHKELGPGLLESTYEHCLAHELHQRGIAAKSQVALPISYKGLDLDATYRIDLLVEDQIIIDLKSVEALLPIHNARLITYLKLAKLKIGFPINFNVVLFKQGLRRLVL